MTVFWDWREVWCPDTLIHLKQQVVNSCQYEGGNPATKMLSTLMPTFHFLFSPRHGSCTSQEETWSPTDWYIVNFCLSDFIWKQNLPVFLVILCLQGIFFRNPLSALLMTDSNRCYFPVRLFIPLMMIQWRPSLNSNLDIQSLCSIFPALSHPSFSIGIQVSFWEGCSGTSPPFCLSMTSLPLDIVKFLLFLSLCSKSLIFLLFYNPEYDVLGDILLITVNSL